ncbi:helix-turn-helix domain-containing protein [Nonomuraea sp. MG754425]|uniref:YjfA family protein n=1 Tax=Nonomuraea sp. MG754425 TaxID=2570319 RepID=UPI001F315414|nr:YjfA family protein [Nonomuraea sp. MG754425]MCF6472746.1 helix-turn-helix domain-containing protein [Nonomuraea sp. MG754425]
MRTLDPAGGPVERFACDLRALRARAGELPFWKMARRCEISKSALAAAVAGHQLPTEHVLRNFVQVCGGDWPYWREHWLQALAEVASHTARPDDVRAAGVDLVPVKIVLPVVTGQTPALTDGEVIASEDTRSWHLAGGFALLPQTPDVTHRRRRQERRLWLVAAVLAGVGGFVLAQGLPWPAGEPAGGPAAPSPAPSVAQVLDGTDPKIAGCGTDKITLDSAPVLLEQEARLRGRRLPAGTKVGVISLAYSPRCAGAWPRFDPTPGLNPDPGDTTVGVLTVEGLRPANNTANSWKMGYIDQTYGNLLLTGMGCVQARARLDMVGQNVVATGRTRCLPQL